MENKFRKDVGYYIVGSCAYHVYQQKDGSLKAKGYVSNKGFVEVDGWEILSAGEKVSQKEYEEYIKWEQSQLCSSKNISER